MCTNWYIVACRLHVLLYRGAQHVLRLLLWDVDRLWCGNVHNLWALASEKRSRLCDINQLIKMIRGNKKIDIC